VCWLATAVRRCHLQVREEATTLALHCAAGVCVTALGNEATDGARAHAVANAGHLVIATPGRLAIALADGSLPPAQLASAVAVLVLDEADLLLSHGFDAALAAVAAAVPRGCQSVLVSATASADVSRLSCLVLHDPTSLDLAHLAPPVAAADGAGGVEHAVARVPAGERLLAVLTLLRLQLVKRKALLFVSTVDGAYRVRLLLDASGVRAAVLHGEMPLNSRHHALEHFNRDLVDVLVAADTPTAEAAAARGAGASAVTDGVSRPASKGARRGAKRRAAADAGECGVARGVDFTGVRTVVNVDVPASGGAYVHRAGRTGRAGAAGLVVTLVASPDDEARLGACEAALQAQRQARAPQADLSCCRQGAAAFTPCSALLTACQRGLKITDLAAQPPLPWSGIESYPRDSTAPCSGVMPLRGSLCCTLWTRLRRHACAASTHYAPLRE
jgi:ATP-dependent RNA helicase DDX56/DBP9